MELATMGAVEPLKSTQQNEQDLTIYCSSWIWRAVECLVKAPDFNASPKWIAERLNVTLEKAVDALDGLERLKLISRTPGGFEANTTLNIVDEMQLGRAEQLQIQSKLAPQIISKLTDKDKFAIQFFLGNAELIGKFTPRIVEILNEMSEAGLQTGAKDVMAVEISFSQLSAHTSEGSLS